AGTGQHPEATVIGVPTGEFDVVIATTTNNGWGDFNVSFKSTATTSLKFKITNNGNVGVSTSTPWGLVSINATTSNPSVPTFVIATTTGTATSTALIVDGQGRVGVGLTAPTAQLQVIGTAS